MLPGAPYPDPAGSGAAPVSGMVIVSSSGPDPIPINPDIIGAGRHRPDVNDLSGLGLHVPIHCAAGEAHKAAGDGYGQ